MKSYLWVLVLLFPFESSAALFLVDPQKRECQPMFIGESIGQSVKDLKQFGPDPKNGLVYKETSGSCGKLRLILNERFMQDKSKGLFTAFTSTAAQCHCLINLLNQFTE